jgi:uncharacterized protein YcbX
MTDFGTVREIWRYPVSSMGGERLSDATLEPGGIPGDRIWGVVDAADGEIAGPEKRRKWRPLPALVSRMGSNGPEIRLGEGTWLEVAAPEAAALASEILQFAVTLKPLAPFGAAETGLPAPRYQRADIHILTTSSLKRLAELLPDPSQSDSRRFRPNILIETVEGLEGFVEQRLMGRTLAVGDIRLTITEPCARCAFTSLAQGELAFEPAVIQTIARESDGGFGSLCKVAEAGTVRLGDTVRLLD